MFEITIYVTAKQFAILEDAVFAVEDATRWNLLEDFESKGYRIQGIFDSEEQAMEAWRELSGVAHVNGEPTVRELSDLDWKDSYKEHFKPWSIGPLHWVPVWLKDEYEIPEGHEVVWLDPGMAFGTGNHETTRLCVQRLIELRERLGPRSAQAVKVVDAGTGSGILAISAVKLGFSQVTGFDNDADSVRVACDNCALNDTMAVRFDVADLESGFLNQPYDVIMANILAPVLIAFRENIVSALDAKGTLILSGILDKEAEKVKEAFEPLRSWQSVEAHQLGEWTSVTLRG